MASPVLAAESASAIAAEAEATQPPRMLCALRLRALRMLRGLPQGLQGLRGKENWPSTDDTPP